MNTNVQKFNKECRDFAKNLKEKELTLFQAKIVLSILRGVINKTPVLTGRARGNWQTNIGHPALGEVFSDSPYEDGESVVQSLTPFKVVHITNNVSYIVYLEEGSSDRAPSGMVAVTIEEMRGMFK